MVLALFCAFTAGTIPFASAANADPPAGAHWLCTGTGTWADVATQVFLDGNVTKAEEIYRAVLAVDPTNQCAVRGMAAVAENAAAVKAKAEKETPQPISGLAQDWSDAVKNYFSPLSEPLLAVLGILLLLLVLARLATPLAVAPEHVAWSPDGLRKFLTTVGFVLMLAGASAPVVVSRLSAALLPGGVAEFLFGIGSITTAVAAVSLLLPRRRKVAGAGLLGWSGLAAGAVVLAVGGLWFVGSLRTWWTLLLTVGSAVGVVGVALVAAARGQMLRLVIEARGTSGTSDTNAAHYLLERLSQLGSQPPRGLEIPEQTDVTQLPTDALTELPEATLAKALFRVLRAFRPAVPWRATVGITDTNTVTVSLSRNGRAVGAASFSRAELNLPALPKDTDQDTKPLVDAATKHLLTAAAAHLLIELSKRHRKLRDGLCGVTDSRSLAMYAIGADPSGAVGPMLRRALFAAAVASDPGNALARVGDLNRLGTSATIDGQLAAAQEATDEHKRLPDKPGYRALRLRLRFTIAATTVNVLLLGGAERQTVPKAVIRFVSELKPKPPEHLTYLVEDLRRAAYFLVKSADHALGHCACLKGALDTVSTWLPEADTALKGPIAYDRACWLATSKTGAHWQRRALNDLRIAVTDPSLRTWARQDPSLANLRSDAKWRVAFRELVCDAPIEFLDITGISPYRAELTKLGVTDAADLLLTSPVTVAKRLSLPLPKVRRWVTIAKLVTGDPGPKPMPVSIVDALVQLDDALQSNLWHTVKPDLALFIPLTWNDYVPQANATA